MSNYLTTDTELTSIANAIRTAGGTSASLVYPSGFISAIQGLQPNLRTLTLRENLLYSQSLSYNAQQGFLAYEQTCDSTGNNISYSFAGTVPWTLDDTFNINGSFTVTQSGSSENITMNTDFVMASGNIILDFSYTGSDLIEKITLTRSSDDRIQLTFVRRNSSSTLKLVGNFQILGYTKGFDIINLNLIDNPQAMIAFKTIALNNDYITSSVGFQTIFSSIQGVSRGAYAFRAFTGSSTFCFNNVNAINMYGFYSITTNASPRPTFSFPEVNSIYNSAFQKAQIGHIYAPKCTLIGSSAFHECYYLEEANFSLVTSIQTYTFGYCSSLTTVSFPVCTTIGSYAFTNCSRLTEVSFPLCTQIYPSAFYLCYSLNTVSFPECSQIWHGAFSNCSALTSINFPKCEWIGNSAFTNCSRLTEVSFSLCTEIASNAFGNCYSLTSINLPECVSINYNVFLNCSKLISISLPKCERILDRTFNNCSNLQTISLPKLSSIGAYVFVGCSSLSAAYFMSSSVVTAGPQTFANTPIAYSSYLGYFGSIYVPSSLLASYKTATNWTTYSSRMVGV